MVKFHGFFLGGEKKRLTRWDLFGHLGHEVVEAGPLAEGDLHAVEDAPGEEHAGLDGARLV